MKVCQIEDRNVLQVVKLMPSVLDSGFDFQHHMVPPNTNGHSPGVPQTLPKMTLFKMFIKYIKYFS